MKPAATDLYDLLIVGAGPAGATAALHARKLGASVLLIEKESFPRPRSCAGWIGPAGVALCAALGLSARKAGAAEFKGVRLHAWDLKKNVVVKDGELTGWVVSRAAFDQALASAAAAAGAKTCFAASPVELTLRDDRVSAKLSDGQSVAGKVLLIGDGAQSATARLANLPAAGGMREVSSGAFVELPADKAATGLELAISAGRIPQIATIVRVGKLVRVAVASRAPAESVEGMLKTFLSSAQSAGLLPAAGSPSHVRRMIPAGVALDMDSHLGKRCLLIGDAGGFAAAFSGEGIYPAMRSGWIAAEVAHKAIGSKLPQDELATFEDAWRTALADYLRMPNTDLSLLMPLVFNNQQMSTRVARAFVLGQQF